MFNLFEKKLGILLTPNDYETIKKLQENFNEKEIKEALDIAYYHNAKKVSFVVSTLRNLKKDNDTKLPEWLNKEYTPEPLTDEDKKEIEEAIECLRDWHPNDFEEWAEAQRKNNGI